MDFEHFVSLLINSRIIDEHEARKTATAFLKGCQNVGQEVTVEQFCAFLIDTNLVTKWQCDKLRMGKWKGFYVDDYLILEQIGKTSDSSLFKARDKTDGKLVSMDFVPGGYVNGRFSYNVEPFIELPEWNSSDKYPR